MQGLEAPQEYSGCSVLLYCQYPQYVLHARPCCIRVVVLFQLAFACSLQAMAWLESRTACSIALTTLPMVFEQGCCGMHCVLVSPAAAHHPDNITI
jgi:hypothetical protein